MEGELSLDRIFLFIELYHRVRVGGQLFTHIYYLTGLIPLSLSRTLSLENFRLDRIVGVAEGVCKTFRIH